MTASSVMIGQSLAAYQIVHSWLVSHNDIAAHCILFPIHSNGHNAMPAEGTFVRVGFPVSYLCCFPSLSSLVSHPIRSMVTDA